MLLPSMQAETGSALCTAAWAERISNVCEYFLLFLERQRWTYNQSIYGSPTRSLANRCKLQDADPESSFKFGFASR